VVDLVAAIRMVAPAMTRTPQEHLRRDAASLAAHPDPVAGDPVDPEMPPRWVRVVVICPPLRRTTWCAVDPHPDPLFIRQAGEHNRRTCQGMLGVPWAGGAAFIIVLVLRSSFGRVEFKVLGTNFKGASGPIVMWILCFLVEIAAIRLLW
jgi:hypothetical protein